MTITKNGQTIAMMLSASDKELIAIVEEFLEERYWCERLGDAERGGYIGARESNCILHEVLNAES